MKQRIRKSYICGVSQMVEHATQRAKELGVTITNSNDMKQLSQMVRDSLDSFVTVDTAKARW